MNELKDITVGALQQKMFYVKYERTYWKMRSALESGNMPMFRIYKRQVDDMRMSLSILGINIKGINQ
jgi:hypothetical protein